MDILDFAMKMELDGRAFYLAQAEHATNADLKQVWSMLADEELKHFEFFWKMKDGQTDIAAAERNRYSESLKAAKNIFVTLAESGSGLSFADAEQSAWLEALKIEEKAESFYREKAAVETNPDRRTLLELIAREEQSHVHLIDGVLTYLRFPESFADSASFRNFQSLEGH